MRHRWAVIALVLLAVALLGNQMLSARFLSASSEAATPDGSAGLAGTPETTATTAGAAAESPTAPVPQVLTHVVAQGETVSGIAAKYGTDSATIKSLNDISDERSLRVGQQLKVLTVAGTVHKIKSGDTLWDIARSYQVALTAVYSANPGLQNSVLKLGQEIILPGAKPAVARQAVASRGSSRSSGSTTSGQSSSGSSSSSSSSGFRWPVSGHITSGYGMRWGKLHAGLDIGVPMGTSVKAAASGTVSYAGWATGYGYLVKIRHSGGYETRYGHNSKLLVKVGQTVEKGQTISLSGSTGFSTGPHLHFEVRKNGSPINPRTVLP